MVIVTTVTRVTLAFTVRIITTAAEVMIASAAIAEIDSPHQKEYYYLHHHLLLDRYWFNYHPDLYVFLVCQ